MKVPVWILSALFVALLGEQAWLVNQVSQLRSDLSFVKGQLGIHQTEAVPIGTGKVSIVNAGPFVIPNP